MMWVIVAQHTSPDQGQGFIAGVTLNQSLYESVLHALLIDGRDHTVEMYQGSGAKWTRSRQVFQELVSFFLPR